MSDAEVEAQVVAVRHSVSDADMGAAEGVPPQLSPEPEPQPEPAGLPPGWVEKRQRSGKVYYFHASTGQTQLDRPV